MLQFAEWPHRIRLQNLSLSGFRASGPVTRRRSGNRLANQKALRDIERFRRALSSYPARFAEDPNVTFENHYRSVMAEKHVAAELYKRR
jgi:hypothetical protein